ncbi:MAG: class I SAM-dependent methyltransferase [Thermofilaceae archaeon]
MSLSSYIFRKFIRDPREALRILRISEELERYTVWRLYNSLAESGYLSRLQEKPWWDFKDKDLAKWVCDILVEEGLAKRTGDMVKVIATPKQPAITTREVADLVPVIDRAMLALPQALETGAKPNLAEEKAAYAKTIGNLSYRLMVEIAVESTGLNKLSEKAVIADVYPRIGTSTITLLELTRARIIAVEPYTDNIEVASRVIRLAGQEKRVNFIQATPEEMRLPEKADVVFMADILHWIPNPHFALTRAHDSLNDKGFLSMIQSIYASTGLVTCLPDYFFGAIRPPPPDDELRELIEETGFKIVKWLESFGIVVVQAILK